MLGLEKVDRRPDRGAGFSAIVFVACVVGILLGVTALAAWWCLR